VVLDLCMPGIDGCKLITEIISAHPQVTVVVISGKNEIETAVTCIQRGAYDYLVKPIRPERLLSAARHALGLTRMRTFPVSREKQPAANADSAFSDIITRDPSMRVIFQYLSSVAATGQPVLITGETGTGKDMIARAVHVLSRRNGKYLAINVGGCDDQMFSDCLFGHRRGAFTGASDQRMGMVLGATAGTLFLDEIGDLSLVSQVKLLRLLQDGEYYPIGSDAPKYSSARVVVATSVDLRAAMDNGAFRRDLFYRLNTHHVHLPPLRERRGDVPLLIEHFLDQATTDYQRAKPALSAELPKLLANYPFPGNIRELRSLVYDAFTRSQDTLSLVPFHRALREAEEGRQGDDDERLTFSTRLPTLKRAHEQLVEEALRRANGNQAQAANLLGITRQALNKRLRNNIPEESTDN
jgi:DNA-binding NtrC family response regulator